MPLTVREVVEMPGKKTEGWDVWGNEVESDINQETVK